MRNEVFLDLYINIHVCVCVFFYMMSFVNAQTKICCSGHAVISATELCVSNTLSNDTVWERAQRSWPFNTGCHLCHLHIEIYSVSFNRFTILCTVNDDIPPNSLQLYFFNCMTQSLHTGEPLIIWNTVSLSEQLFFFLQILLMTCC